MKAKKENMVRKNTRTGYFLRNNEVFCSSCGRNFGDIYTLEKHRVKSYTGDLACVDPQSVNMTAHINFCEAIVWKYTKW
jgi:5-methylcytosine-specific restriction endonuclease McrA